MDSLYPPGPKESVDDKIPEGLVLIFALLLDDMSNCTPDFVGMAVTYDKDGVKSAGEEIRLQKYLGGR